VGVGSAAGDVGVVVPWTGDRPAAAEDDNAPTVKVCTERVTDGMFAIVVVLAMVVSSQEVDTVLVGPLKDVKVAVLIVEDVEVAPVNPLENADVAVVIPLEEVGVAITRLVS